MCFINRMIFLIFSSGQKTNGADDLQTLKRERQKVLTAFLELAHPPL